MPDVVTRFPPSPTGFLHIGGARTALFNWLFARKHGGKFVLRIEDTDKARSTPEMTRAILDGMTWLGLDWDEGPFFQSERNHLYNQYIDQLLENDRAYYCSCSPEDVEAMREKARAEGRKPKYEGVCRGKCLDPGEGRVVRFKAPQTGAVTFEDMVKGPISVDVQELDDLIIRRGDGSPTYHMAVVVDDALMGITHILRGDDHVSNTPRQILLFEAMGFPLPVFGHVPMILGGDKKKLSKRHGALSVMEYEAMGFLPDAMVNYLARLGWSHGDQELFTRDELVGLFDSKNLSTSPSAFDMDKLKWINAHYIKGESPTVLAGKVLPFLKEQGFSDVEEGYLERILPLFQERAQTLVELAEEMRFLLIPADEIEYDPKAAKKALTPEGKAYLLDLSERLQALEDFSHDALEACVKGYLADKELKFKAIGMPVRVALVGAGGGPGLHDIMEVLGKDETAKRLKRAATL